MLAFLLEIFEVKERETFNNKGGMKELNAVLGSLTAKYEHILMRFAEKSIWADK